MHAGYLKLSFAVLLQVIAISGQTHYEILGVPPDTSPGDIKRAFHGLAKKDHQDRNEDGKQQFILVRQGELKKSMST